MVPRWAIVGFRPAVGTRGGASAKPKPLLMTAIFLGEAPRMRANDGNSKDAGVV